MFSSPAIRILNSENAGSMVQRKPGSSSLSRKPFLDRAVNGKTPERNIHKKLKDKAVAVTKEQPKHDDLDCKEFICSRSEIQATYNDIFPPSMRLQEKDILNVLRNFCGKSQVNTPPPSPEPARKAFIQFDDSFYNLPESPEPNMQEFCLPKMIPVSLDDSGIGMPQLDMDL